MSGIFTIDAAVRAIFFARPVVAAVGDHAIADLEICYAGAGALDHTRDFRHRREREGRLHLVIALDHQDVEKVQRCRLDRNHGLARSGNGIRHVGQNQFVRLAILRAEDGFHGHTWLIDGWCFEPDIMVSWFMPHKPRAFDGDQGQTLIRVATG
ncbi:hypothetical protein ACVMIH_007587 [Bradyrhizobium sp. USDA 4503]